MAGGTILGIVFFLLTAMAATMATISIVQVLIATFTEQFKIERKKAIVINIVIIVAFGILAALSANPEGVLGQFKIFGDTFFNLFSDIVSNILLPINGILVTILIGYFVSRDTIKNQLTNNGTIKNEAIVKIMFFTIRYITPILVLIVFLKTFI